MLNEAYTVEDYLELLVGFRNESFKLETTDISILHSIARQIAKGIALTDRQHSLIKNKLLSYKSQFEEKNYNNLEASLDVLRLPLREIDRSKYIKIVENSEVYNTVPYESHKQDRLWIKIRFPFSKKIIVLIEEIKFKILNEEYYHKKGTHEHFFLFTEKNLYTVVKALKEKSFDIETDIIEYYEKLEQMNNNKKDYIPGIYNFKLQNLDTKAIEYMISSIGEPTRENLSLYIDRKDQFGLEHFDDDDYINSVNSLTTLSQKIATRNSSIVFVSSKKYTLNQLVESILELYRFPLLVLIPNSHQTMHLSNIHNAFNGIIHSESSSVLFRLDNADDEGLRFNSFIKEHSLNNPVDSDTKIVYTDITKMPKPLIKSEWMPNAVLLLESIRLQSKVEGYLNNCDLVIHYDDTVSQITRFNERTNRIQTL